MAAAPQNGTLTFVGDSGRTFSVDVYFSDVANAAALFNPNGTAGTSSLGFYRPPENCTLVDFSVTTGLTDTTTGVFTVDDNIVPGTAIKWAPHVSTINNRPPIKMRFRAGSNIGMNQLA